MKSKSILSFILSLGICVISSFPLAAVPGVDSYLKDINGEYVYYQDTSFTRTSYVGFLYYDDSTYSVRYYAPATVDEGPVDVQILLTLDPTQEKLTFTGERVISEPQENDSTLINYMHDLCYDFTIRRQRAGDISGFNDINKKANYDLFGGQVTMKYNALIPIFNLKSISDLSGTEQFKIVTTGRLLSNDDNSFTDFRGIDAVVTENVKALPKTGKKKADVTFTLTKNQSINLDSSWTLASEMEIAKVWTQGNFAMISMTELGLEDSSDKMLAQIVRAMLQSAQGIYNDWSKLNLKISDKQIKISSNYFHSAENKIIHDTKLFSKLSDNSYALFNINVYDDVYIKKASYYDKLINTYKIN